MKKVLLAVAVILLAIGGANAQKFKPVPNFLKGETEINVVFDYSKTVFDGVSQQKYYKSKGAKWVEEWEGKRREGNARAFIKSINAELAKNGVSADTNLESQYTLIVEVLDCNFGAYSGPFSVPAKLKCTIRIVKTGTTETLASVTMKEAQNSYTVVGTPVDFDRMYLAFGQMGDEVGERLTKFFKK